MLEKDFCTTPTIHEYEFAHYRHRLHGTAADEDGSSTEPKRGPQLVDLRDRALPLGLARPPACGTEHQDQAGRSHQAAFAPEGKASAAIGQDRRPRRDTDSEEPLDSAFRSPGPAGRISPAGVVIEPYYLGDSVTQISPTTYSFSRRRRTVLGAPLSEADLTAVARRSSSTTTFSEEDFQISYHKVLDSSAASWLGEGEDDDVFGTTRSRYRQRRDAGSVPSVELPSIRATHKTQSEQLASRGSGVEDVAVQRPRSEDLSVHVRETPRATLGHLETSIVRGALKRIYQPSRTDSDTDRHVTATRVGFGSSPAGEERSTWAAARVRQEDAVAAAVDRHRRRRRDHRRRVQARRRQHQAGDAGRGRLGAQPTRQGGPGAHTHAGQAPRRVQHPRRSAGGGARGGGAVRSARQVTYEERTPMIGDVRWARQKHSPAARSRRCSTVDATYGVA
ncbi:uncharacterized protein LOC142592764 isoform X2 [Dermacentor variabilis]|uniref:uncharacterized protein LOC142592764 isoform X2 n=1 Tax=Dermacentor variabilis TaxID=34621 RepID=UPI003F5C0222